MKRTKEEFVSRAIAKHGDEYDYSKVVYLGSTVNVEIICPKHGSFWQEPATHLRGCGCPMCSPYHKIDTEEFIKRAKKTHGDDYDYSLSEYVDATVKVKIICPKHGVFEQKPSAHIHGQGCPECKKEKTSSCLRKPLSVFLKEMKDMYGEQYEFSRSSYNGTHEKMTVICKTHGEFARTPHELLDGRGCPVCLPNMKKDTDFFIKRAKEIHGDKYGYDKVVYKDIHTKVCIVCPIHGEFFQEPNYHINIKAGCPVCGHEEGGKKLSILKRTPQNDFIEKCRERHGDRYDYSHLSYLGVSEKIYIVCPEHGVFWQNAGDHLRGRGCPSCSRRIGEEEVAKYLTKEGIGFSEQYQIKQYDKFSYRKFVVDFYLPDYNTIIEYNGEQHYRPVDFFGGEEQYKKQHDRDVALRMYCKEQGIKLIEIPYWEIKNVDAILSKELKSLIKD